MRADTHVKRERERRRARPVRACQLYFSFGNVCVGNLYCTVQTGEEHLLFFFRPHFHPPFVFLARREQNKLKGDEKE